MAEAKSTTVEFFPAQQSMPVRSLDGHFFVKWVVRPRFVLQHMRAAVDAKAAKTTAATDVKADKVKAEAKTDKVAAKTDTAAVKADVKAAVTK